MLALKVLGVSKELFVVRWVGSRFIEGAEMSPAEWWNTDAEVDGTRSPQTKIYWIAWENPAAIIRNKRVVLHVPSCSRFHPCSHTEHLTGPYMSIALPTCVTSPSHFFFFLFFAHLVTQWIVWKWVCGDLCVWAVKLKPAIAHLSPKWLFLIILISAAEDPLALPSQGDPRIPWGDVLLLVMLSAESEAGDLHPGSQSACGPTDGRRGRSRPVLKRQ